MDKSVYLASKFSDVVKYVEKYVFSSYAVELKRRTTPNSSPTESSIGVYLTIEAIEKASRKFNLSARDIALKLDDWKDFTVLDFDGDWWTFNGFASHFKK